MGVSGHPSREQTLIFVIGCFSKPSGCLGAAARQPSRLGTNKVPSRSRIYDRRPFSHQQEILLANKGESIYDNAEGLNDDRPAIGHGYSYCCHAELCEASSQAVTRLGWAQILRSTQDDKEKEQTQGV